MLSCNFLLFSSSFNLAAVNTRFASSASDTTPSRCATKLVFKAGSAAAALIFFSKSFNAALSEAVFFSASTTFCLFNSMCSTRPATSAKIFSIDSAFSALAMAACCSSAVGVSFNIPVPGVPLAWPPPPPPLRPLYILAINASWSAFFLASSAVRSSFNFCTTAASASFRFCSSSASFKALSSNLSCNACLAASFNPTTRLVSSCCFFTARWSPLKCSSATSRTSASLSLTTAICAAVSSFSSVNNSISVFTTISSGSTSSKILLLLLVLLSGYKIVGIGLGGGLQLGAVSGTQRPGASHANVASPTIV